MEQHPSQPTEVPRARVPLGRAAFLGTVVAGVAGIAVLSRVSGGVGATIADLGGAVPGVDALVPTGGWRIYNVQDPMPTFDPATYALTIGGNVESPAVLRWQDVQATQQDTQVCDFHCVTGWSVADVHWKGIRPQTVIDLVRPRASAKHVTFQSLEQPYFDQLTLEQFLLADVMLATEMDGKPLTRAHGAPLRLVMPKMYGYKGVKWLSGISFDDEPQPGFWETRGYDADAWVGRDVQH